MTARFLALAARKMEFPFTEVGRTCGPGLTEGWWVCHQWFGFGPDCWMFDWRCQTGNVVGVKALDFQPESI